MARDWTGLVLAAVLASACGQTAVEKTGGNPQQGKLTLRKYGCQACHTIPGVSTSDGLVGPPLDRIGSRPHLAGRLPNTPENLMRWIREPQSVAPGTAMPDMAVTEQDGRDMAAYLYTLQ